MATSATPRAIIAQTLRHEQPAVCPYYVWVSEEMRAPLAEYYGAEQFIGHANEITIFAGSYTALREVVARTVWTSGDRFADEYGIRYRQGNIKHVERPALIEPSLKNYTFPDLSTDEHFNGFEEWIETHAERFRIAQLGQMFFERAWYMRGMEDFLMDLHVNPAFVEELLEGLEAVCMAVIERLLADYGDRIDAIGLSEDYGTQRSLLISPGHWRRFVKPHLARICDRIHRGGKLVYIHSCGHVAPIVADMIEVGVDFLQPIQPEANDIFELKRHFGKDLCLIGGISTQQTLPYGSPEDVCREVRACLDRMAAGGGYIMAPAKAIMQGVPIKNAIALIDAFVNQSGD